MTTPKDPPDIHRAAVDAEGNRIGKISKMFLDEQTGQPEWVLVETGLLGARRSFAPIRGSKLDGEPVVVAVSKDQVKDAPNVESGEQFSDSAQEALRRYCPGHLGTAGETSGWQQAGGPGNFVVSVCGAAPGDEHSPHGPYSSPLSGCPFTVIIRSGLSRIALSARLYRSLLS